MYILYKLGLEIKTLEVLSYKSELVLVSKDQ